jgi:hypothetical protein
MRVGGWAGCLCVLCLLLLLLTGASRHHALAIASCGTTSSTTQPAIYTMSATMGAQQQPSPSLTKWPARPCAGGGTVDFTMHMVEQRAAGHKVLSEATYRACLLQGSKKVDSAFQDWLTEFVGRRDFEEWRTSTSKDYLSLMTQWETAKRAFNGNTPEVGVERGP